TNTRRFRRLVRVRWGENAVATATPLFWLLRWVVEYLERSGVLSLRNLTPHVSDTSLARLGEMNRPERSDGRTPKWFLPHYRPE
ncbi:hypothetical protein ACPV5U_28300, partial [Vibrio mediterranei]